MVDPDRLLVTLESLLSYESPQSHVDLVRAFIAEEVAPRARRCKFDNVVLDEAGNLVAHRYGTNRALAPIICWTYGATYPPASMRDPYPAKRIIDGTQILVRGRGAAEQRTGLAAALEAMQSLVGVTPPTRGYGLVTCVAGEMGNHTVAEALVRTHRLRAWGIVLAIATGGKIGLGNLGRVDIHVEVEGTPAHSSNPAAGINAVDGAVEFALRLRELPPLPADPDLGQATLAITSIRSEPVAPHTIPARCFMVLDRRLVPGEDPVAAVSSIAQCATGIAPARVTVRGGDSNFPGKLSANHPLAQRAVTAAKEAGLDGGFFYRRAALDAGYFLKLDIPAIMWGPGDPALAHTDEERASLAEAERLAHAYRTFLLNTCYQP
jgi:succinyl-diaminopimelate desuccinylase